MAIKGLVDYNLPMDFGKGVNTVTMEPMGYAVEGGLPSAVDGGGGWSALFNLRKVISNEQYKSAFNLNVEASASWGLFGGSAKFDYSEDQSYNKYSVYLVASILLQGPFRQIQKPQLTQVAKDYIDAGDVDGFREQFGDRFISGMQFGGEYYAVFEFTTESEEDRQKVSSEIDVGGFCWEASAKVKMDTEKIKSKSDLRITSFQRGGADEGIKQEVEINEIINKSRDFAMEIKGNPVPYKAYLEDYKILARPKGPNYIDVENAQLQIKKYYEDRNSLQMKYNDIKYVMDYPAQFVNPDMKKLAEYRQNITKAIDAIKNNASRCANNVKDCKYSEPDELKIANEIVLPDWKMNTLAASPEAPSIFKEVPPPKMTLPLNPEIILHWVEDTLPLRGSIRPQPYGQQKFFIDDILETPTAEKPPGFTSLTSEQKNAFKEWAHWYIDVRQYGMITKRQGYELVSFKNWAPPKLKELFDWYNNTQLMSP